MRSLVRQTANIHTVEWDYNQLAVVATLTIADVSGLLLIYLLSSVVFMCVHDVIIFW